MNDEDGVVQSFRVDPDLRRTFQQVCQSRDLTASQVLRQFMRDYVRKYGQLDIFKD